MAKEVPVIFMMLAIVILCLAVLGIATYYGTADWTWIAQQNATFVLVLIVLSIAAFVLVGWLKGRK